MTLKVWFYQLHLCVLIFIYSLLLFNWNSVFPDLLLVEYAFSQFEAAAVNLVVGEKPADIYSEIAVRYKDLCFYLYYWRRSRHWFSLCFTLGIVLRTFILWNSTKVAYTRQDYVLNLCSYYSSLTTMYPTEEYGGACL